MRRLSMLLIFAAILLGLFLAYGVETREYACADMSSYQITIASLSLPKYEPYPGDSSCVPGYDIRYRGFIAIKSECIDCVGEQGISYYAESDPSEATIVFGNILIPLIPAVLFALFVRYKYVKNLIKRKR